METWRPRAERTPETESDTAIDIVYEVFSRMCELCHGKSEDEIKADFGSLVQAILNRQVIDGDKEAERFYALNENAENHVDNVLSIGLSTTISYVILAKRAADRDLAWSYVVSAMYWAASLRSLDFGMVVSDNAASRMARNAAQAKLANDPKQAEKVLVRECWEEWQKNPGNYKSKAMFARDMLTKCESLTSQKKIEDWCRQWGAK